MASIVRTTSFVPMPLHARIGGPPIETRPVTLDRRLNHDGDHTA
jgi:hypothetical protein